MKNHSLFIIFIAVVFGTILVQVRPAYAQWVVSDTIMDAWTATKDAADKVWQVYEKDRDVVNNHIANLNNEIAQHMSDQNDKNTSNQMDQDLMAHAITQNSEQQKVSQDAISDAGKKVNDAMLAAIQKYKPTDEQCVNATNKYIRDYGIVQAGLQAAATMTNINNAVKNGAPGGVTGTRNQVAQNIINAMKNPTSTDPNVIKDNPSQIVAQAQCQTPECYNQWLSQQITNTALTSVGDKPPVNASSNPQLISYFIERAKSDNKKSEASSTLSRLLPKLYKNKNFYDQVSQAYISAGVVTNATDAAARLNAEYPNSSKIGLSYYEMQEAEFNALTKGNNTVVQVAQGAEQRQLNAENLQAEAAAVQISKIENDEAKKAIDELGVNPPALSANAISTK